VAEVEDKKETRETPCSRKDAINKKETEEGDLDRWRRVNYILICSKRT